ncbi:UbiA family prenyltransferase [Agrobacterium pusense]|uniref:UbiA family prenyltransferase n=1 Tax=Agrobacterium pusense TaxID=648995 RepID=UPI002F3FCDD6
MEAKFRSLSNDVALVFDLDGTLIHSDTLAENFVEALFTSPAQLLRSAPKMMGGKAAIKETVASIVALDPAFLLYREEIVELARSAKEEGRNVYLVTAAHQSIADAISEHLGVFDGAKGSDGRLNLKGINKLAWLKESFPGGFIYAGDSAADVKIWQEAEAAILVGRGVKFASRLKSGSIVDTLAPHQSQFIKDWASELRLHQWSKNLLLFIPLLLGHLATDLGAIGTTVAAFLVLSLIASGTYIVNDLADLKADRAHPTKKNRAIASGRIGVMTGLAVSLGLIGLGLISAILIGRGFAILVSVYLCLTLLYSFRLKRLPFLDVSIIGTLFTIRVLMGTAIHPELDYSPWLTSFSMCFFFSLAMAKRHVEVMRANAFGSSKISGRGYSANDWPLTLAYGVATAMASIVIMLLFVALDVGSADTYSNPVWLYLAPAAMFLWTQRIWLLSHRTELNDDPIIFAIKDRASYVIGLVIFAGFALAV